MAEVNGSFGNQPIELNNAATESTLRLLLQATLSANKQTSDSVRRMAERAGLNAVNIEVANRGISRFDRALVLTGSVLGGLNQATASLQKGFDTVVSVTSKLAEGTGQASDLLKSMSMLPGPLGLLASGATLLAQFQEKQLQNYRELTKTGVNFAGSLTDLRMAAANTYMTMDQFSNLMKNNADLVNRLGTTSDEGARAFVRVSKEFNESQVGKQLRSLGYSSEEMNEQLLRSMALQGKAGLQDLDNVERVQKSTGDYLGQLDALTKLTGVSREKLAQEQKKAEMNAAFQAKLAAMAPEEQAKVRAAYDAAAASGIAGATDVIMSQVLGLVPQTKEAQLLYATMPRVASGFAGMADSAQTVGTTMSDVNRGLGEVVEGTREATEGQEQLIGALAAGGAKEAQVLQSGLALKTKMEQKGIKTTEDLANSFAAAKIEQETQAKSQAAAAAETEIAMRKLSAQINEQLMKVIEALLPHLNTVVQQMAQLAGYLLESPKALAGLGLAVGGLAAVMIASKIKLALAAAKTAMGEPGGSSGGDGAGGGGGGGGKAGIGKKLLGGLKGFGIGSIIGLGAGFAADALGRDTAAGATADTLGTAASFAGTGAMLGSIIPGAGTLVGGALGGLVGGAYGLYKNAGTMFGKGTTNVPSGPIDTSDLGIPPVTAQDQNESALQSILSNPTESLAKEVERLNTQVSALIKHARETAENTKRTIDVVRSLSGNLYPTP